MKNKFICLLAMLFLLTGCGIEYNLNIDENTFDEDVRVILPNNDQMMQIVYRSIKIKQISFVGDKANDRHYYHLNADTTDSKNIYLDYSYKYNKKNILKSNAITQCYKDVSLNDDDNYIDISTSDEFRCLYRDGAQLISKATINITTPLKVVSNNADKVKGDTYTWKIDKNNYKKKPIKIKIKNESKDADKAIITLFIIIGIIVLLLLIILCYIVNKKKQNNKL